MFRQTEIHGRSSIAGAALPLDPAFCIVQQAVKRTDKVRLIIHGN